MWQSCQKHEPIDDLGCLLVSFLELFGKIFDYSNDAISIRSGGVCKKSEIVSKGIVVKCNYEINYNRRSEDGDPPWERLLVEDYFTGLICNGFYKYASLCPFNDLGMFWWFYCFCITILIGRDVSSGTFRISEIQRLFGAVYKRLSGQYLIPPLPPDSSYLSTLSTLFPVAGAYWAFLNPLSFRVSPVTITSAN